MPEPVHKYPPREYWKRRVHNARRPLYVRAVGYPTHTEIEPAFYQSRVDHVWMTMDVPPVGPVLVSINTLSRFNRDAGFDPRVRLAVIPFEVADAPEPVVEDEQPLDYRDIEQGAEFVTMDHDPLEELLLAKCGAAIRAEVWGELYIREHLGIHQIHSRRKSCAVRNDVLGRDGALKLYFREGHAELLLFKFCGQP